MPIPINPTAGDNLRDFFQSHLSGHANAGRLPIPVRILLRNGHDLYAEISAAKEDHLCGRECSMAHGGLKPVASPWGALKIPYTAIDALWIGMDTPEAALDTRRAIPPAV